jgi:hypothetical protein
VIIASAIILAVAAFVCQLHIKDVYYGFGRAVALIGNGATIRYEKDQALTFIISDRLQETYIGHLGDSVYKLLLKNGFIRELT